MKSLKLPCIFLLVTFLCVANSNPLLNFFGKSDDKAEGDDKATASVAPPAKSVGEATTTTTTTPEPSASCGGLKGFLHICDKNEPTEPPKTVKARSVSEKDSDEDSDESESNDSDDDDSDEKTKEKGEKEGGEASPPSESTSEGGVAKRQVGDPEAPVLGEVPPVIADAVEIPKNSSENEEKQKRQIDSQDSSIDDDENITEENFRRRRDCRDRDGDYEKDCRRKREYVPPCFDLNCKNNKPTAETNK